MSWEASTYVLGQKVGSAARKLVLMGFANHAHADGTASFPGLETIAEYAECDKRTVQRHVKALVEEGWMREGDQELVSHYAANKRPIVYNISMTPAQRAEWAAYHAAGANLIRERATTVGRKGGTASAQVRRGDTMSPPEVVSNAEVPGGDNLTPPNDGVRGDNLPPAGVTNDNVGGDTGVTQTTQETSPKNQNPFSSPAATAAVDAEPSKSTTDARNNSPEVTALCEHLRERIVSNGTPEHRVTITAEWRNQARLLLDRDGRETEKVHALIDWCQDDSFWRRNVLSMPTFREQYDRLRLAAIAEWEKKRGTRRAHSDDAWSAEAGAPRPVELTDEAAAAMFGLDPTRTAEPRTAAG